ncbi:MAG: hypothetical protein QXG00_07440 [Candidatus Woesearchaeota archaeon]
MSTPNQNKRYLGSRSVYFGNNLPENDLEEGFLFFKTNVGLYIYRNNAWEIVSTIPGDVPNINTLTGILNISKGGTGATTAATALSNLGGVTMAQVQAEIQTTNRNSQGNKTVSTSTPTGGNDGDIWYQYE